MYKIKTLAASVAIAMSAFISSGVYATTDDGSCSEFYASYLTLWGKYQNDTSNLQLKINAQDEYQEYLKCLNSNRSLSSVTSSSIACNWDNYRARRCTYAQHLKWYEYNINRGN